MKNKSKLGVFELAMMSVVSIFTLRTLPLMAEYGISAIFYYVLAALVYFIPFSLVCAELATGWPKTGGLYIWVREAFGRRVGFLAIWFEWINTVISFPATLSYIVATLAYAIDPSLVNNKLFMLALMLAIFWGATFVNFLGIKFSSWVSNIGLIFGTIFPCLLIMSLAIGWIFAGKPIHMNTAFSHVIPSFHFNHSAFLVGLLLGYAGMQITAFHAQETKNPQTDYPRAIFIAVIVILLISIFGSLAISTVIPHAKISILTGLMQAAEAFFDQFHLHWMVPVIAILTAIGTLAMLNMWVIGPCKGLLATAQYGDLPPIMERINRRGAPTVLLLLQAIIATIMSLVYLFMPSVDSSYWILIVLTAVITLLMNILIFAAAIYLRYKAPSVPRAYKIPGGKIGIWCVAGISIIICIIAFFIGFIPPAQLQTGRTVFYEMFLILGVIIVCVIPFLLPFKKK